VGYLTLPNSLRGKDMSKIKNWIMEMEELIYDAIENGAGSVEEVSEYVESKMEVVDKNYVSKVYKELAEFGSYPRLDL
jgi:predicted transcriptional regulator